MNSSQMLTQVASSCKLPVANLALVSDVRMLWSRRRSGAALSMRRVVVSADRWLVAERHVTDLTLDTWRPSHLKQTKPSCYLLFDFDEWQPTTVQREKTIKVQPTTSEGENHQSAVYYSCGGKPSKRSLLLQRGKTIKVQPPAPAGENHQNAAYYSSGGKPSKCSLLLQRGKTIKVQLTASGDKIF